MRFLFISEWAEDLNCREQKKRSVISKVNLPVDRKRTRPKGFFLRGNTERETEWWIDVIKTKRRPNINWLQRRRSRKLVYFNPNLRKMNMRWSRGLEQEQSRILWPHWSSVFHCCLEWPEEERRWWLKSPILSGNRAECSSRWNCFRRSLINIVIVQETARAVCVLQLISVNTSWNDSCSDTPAAGIWC